MVWPLPSVLPHSSAHRPFITRRRVVSAHFLVFPSFALIHWSTIDYWWTGEHMCTRIYVQHLACEACTTSLVYWAVDPCQEKPMCALNDGDIDRFVPIIDSMASSITPWSCWCYGTTAQKFGKTSSEFSCVPCHRSHPGKQITLNKKMNKKRKFACKNTSKCHM